SSRRVNEVSPSCRINRATSAGSAAGPSAGAAGLAAMPRTTRPSTRRWGRARQRREDMRHLLRQVETSLIVHATWPIARLRYFREDIVRRPKKGAKTVRVRMPGRQVVNQRAVPKWRDLKWEARGPARGEGS